MVRIFAAYYELRFPPNFQTQKGVCVSNTNAYCIWQNMATLVSGLNHPNMLTTAEGINSVLSLLDLFFLGHYSSADKTMYNVDTLV